VIKTEQPSDIAPRSFKEYNSDLLSNWLSSPLTPFMAGSKSSLRLLLGSSSSSDAFITAQDKTRQVYMLAAGSY
jgi:hypothetical protein